MGRWQPDSHGRLERAALALYRERGFDQTTAAEIAKLAGVTERTFFRHFADKREVLFWGATTLRQILVGAIEDAPESTGPIDAVAAAIEAVAPVFEERRDFARQRQIVIAANQELQERELVKLASLASALTEALHRRGVEEPAARLAAETGMAVFRVAFDRWTTETNQRDLSQIMRESLGELKALIAGQSRPPVPAGREISETGTIRGTKMGNDRILEPDLIPIGARSPLG